MTHTFEIKDNFYLDGKPFQIISGGIHYFRVVPEYWKDRLEKLKAMGCNTVETYIPWNMHEPNKGEFHFDGICKNSTGVRSVGDYSSITIYLCRMGVWRTAGLAFGRGWHEASRLL